MKIKSSGVRGAYTFQHLRTNPLYNVMKHIERKYLILAEKWLNGSATPEERKAFSDWYGENQDAEIEIPEHGGADDEQYRERLLLKVRSEIGSEQKVRPLWYRLSIAAAVVLMIGSGLAYYLYQRRDTVSDQAMAVVADVLPGGDKATLTLSDGSILALDQVADGALREGKGFVITKNKGELIYETSGTQGAEITYNIIRTPRGGQFRVVLPDGSKVWLNSQSSLKYPTVFRGGERFVELTGEGYFEVAKIKGVGGAVPFRINVTNREVVEVLGTHFNIMAYTDEKDIKTTLLEGSVKVVKPGTGRSSVLRPGQQSVYNTAKGFQISSDIDASESISWKNGLISYRDADIQTIMRQVERWYDVEVIYSEGIPKRSFTGGISRNSRLSSVLKVLELNDIHFKIKDRQITVLP